MRKTAPYELQIRLKAEDLLLLGIGFAFLVGVFILINIVNSVLVIPEKSVFIKNTEAESLQVSSDAAKETNDITPASSYRNEFEDAWNSLGKAHEEGKRKRKKAFDTMFKHSQERFRRAQENF